MKSYLHRRLHHPPPAVAPVANFTASPLVGGVPLFVTFTDSSTNTPTSWLWEKNDGSGWTTFSASQFVSDNFGEATWDIRLTVTNSGGSDSLTRTGYIVPTSFVPTIDFTGDPLTGTELNPVSFTASSDGTPTSWLWERDNGSGYSTFSTVQNPSGISFTPGSWSIRLTVQNVNGPNVVTKANYVNPTYAAPVADFTATPLSGSAPLQVQFTNTSNYYSGSPQTPSWDLGDAMGSSSDNPLVTYNNPGIYTVSLTVQTTQGGSDTETKTNYIEVT